MATRFLDCKKTIEHIAPLVKQAGITRLADISYLDDVSDLNVFSAIRPGAKSLCVSMGKSLDRQEAQCGALMESLETFYAEQLQPEYHNIPYKTAKSNGHALCLNQYALNATLNDDYPINWCVGRSLVSGEPIWIPHCLLSLDSSEFINQVIGTSSTGLASGNNFEEAIIYSFLELIERSHVQTKRHYQITNIDKALLGHIDLSKADYAIDYFPNDYNLAIIRARLYSKNPFANQRVFAGYCCHFDKEIAVLKAFNEALQSKVGIIAGVRDDLNASYYQFSSRSKKASSFKTIQYDVINSLTTPLDSQLSLIKTILDSHQLDLAYFVYVNEPIVVVKAFLVSNG